MAVANVNDPRRVNVEDPKAVKYIEDKDVAALKSEVEKARARRELVQETKLTNDLTRPQEAPEPPFKVSGSINLGNMDMQAEQQRLRDEKERDRKENQVKVEKAERDAADAREALSSATLKHVQDNLLSRIEALQNAVQSSRSGDIASELDKIEAVAAKLGLQRGTGTRSDFESQLALEKFKLEQKREDRKYMLELKKDERLWTIELKKLEQSAKEAEARTEAERTKYSFIAGLPEQLGGVIASGIRARADGIGTQPTQSRTPISPSTSVKGIEAIIGEAGEIDCPTCKTKVGVGPTTQTTMCAGCGQKFSIKRIAQPPESVQPPEEETGDRETVR